MSIPSDRVRIAMIEGPLGFSDLRARLPAAKFQVVTFGSGRAAIRAQSRPDAWIIADRLVDMLALDCIEMLIQGGASSRIFVVADQFDADTERRCFRLERVKYLSQPMALHWLVRLLHSQSQLTHYELTGGRRGRAGQG